MIDQTDLQERIERQNEIAEELAKKYPALHPITLLVVAGDYVSAERVGKAYLEKRLTFERACNLIGSYARFEWAVEQLEQENVDPNEFYSMLPDLWCSSDILYTDSRYLQVWQKAWVLNKRKVIVKNEKLPRKRRQLFLVVYRGQVPDRLPGFSWTLDVDIARKFAQGASARIPTEGDVMRGMISVSQVYAYINVRKEKEVIFDPKNLLLPPEVVESWRFKK